MTPEGKIEKALCDRIKALGGEVRKVQWIGRHSAPDRLVLLPGYHPFVELKRPKKGAEGAQIREHARLRKAGFKVMVINSFEQIDEEFPR